MDNLSVDYFDDVDHFFAEIDISRYWLIILDVMIPPGNTFRLEDTKEGLLTGVFVYERLRALSSTIQIIILTHLVGAEEQFSEERYCQVMQKSKYSPTEFLKSVRLLRKELTGENGVQASGERF